MTEETKRWYTSGSSSKLTLGSIRLYSSSTGHVPIIPPTIFFSSCSKLAGLYVGVSLAAQTSSWEKTSSFLFQEVLTKIENVLKTSLSFCPAIALISFNKFLLRGLKAFLDLAAGAAGHNCETYAKDAWDLICSSIPASLSASNTVILFIYILPLLK